MKSLFSSCTALLFVLFMDALGNQLSYDNMNAVNKDASTPDTITDQQEAYTLGSKSCGLWVTRESQLNIVNGGTTLSKPQFGPRSKTYAWPERVKRPVMSEIPRQGQQIRLGRPVPGQQARPEVPSLQGILKKVWSEKPPQGLQTSAKEQTCNSGDARNTKQKTSEVKNGALLDGPTHRGRWNDDSASDRMSLRNFSGFAVPPKWSWKDERLDSPRNLESVTKLSNVPKPLETSERSHYATPTHQEQPITQNPKMTAWHISDNHTYATSPKPIKNEHQISESDHYAKIIENVFPEYFGVPKNLSVTSATYVNEHTSQKEIRPTQYIFPKTRSTCENQAPKSIVPLQTSGSNLLHHELLLDFIYQTLYSKLTEPPNGAPKTSKKLAKEPEVRNFKNTPGFINQIRLIGDPPLATTSTHPPLTTTFTHPPLTTGCTRPITEKTMGPKIHLFSQATSSENITPANPFREKLATPGCENHDRKVTHPDFSVGSVFTAAIPTPDFKEVFFPTPNYPAQSKKAFPNPGGRKFEKGFSVFPTASCLLWRTKELTHETTETSWRDIETTERDWRFRVYPSPSVRKNNHDSATTGAIHAGLALGTSHPRGPTRPHFLKNAHLKFPNATLDQSRPFAPPQESTSNNIMAKLKTIYHQSDGYTTSKYTKEGSAGMFPFDHGITSNPREEELKSPKTKDALESNPTEIPKGNISHSTVDPLLSKYHAEVSTQKKKEGAKFSTKPQSNIVHRMDHRHPTTKYGSGTFEHAVTAKGGKGPFRFPWNSKEASNNTGRPFVAGDYEDYRSSKSKRSADGTVNLQPKTPNRAHKKTLKPAPKRRHEARLWHRSRNFTPKGVDSEGDISEEEIDSVFKPLIVQKALEVISAYSPEYQEDESLHESDRDKVRGKNIVKNKIRSSA